MRGLTDRVGHVDRVEVARGQEAIDGFEADVVGVDVVRLLPAERLHRGVGRGPHARRLGADDRVLAVRLVPDRDDLDALLGGQHAGPQLRLRLVREPIADADGVFGERKQDEASEGLDIDVVALRAGVRKPPMWLMRGV